MSGLRHPRLEEWHRWSERQNRTHGTLRAAKARVRPSAPTTPSLYLPQGDIRTVVVLDAVTPSARFAVHAPLQYLDPRTTAVLSSVVDPALFEGGDWSRTDYRAEAQLGSRVDAVLSLGSYLGLARELRPWAHRNDIRFVLAQHGLLTPWAPPAADGDHLLAWTKDDASYWRSDNPTVTTQVVGSQMLWSATQLPAAPLVDDRPVVLGQLHGIEMPKRDKLTAYLSFCRGKDVSYRPHPSEVDVASRAVHRMMKSYGIQFETSGRSLTELGRPVVSIFSTGSLEAAHRGLPAWVTHPRPPEWLQDFWRRYRLQPWGNEPTASWHRPAREPAAEVARIVAS